MKKSARKTAIGKPFIPHDPRSGRGPRRGAPNAGRPTDAFKALCRRIVSRGARALVANGVMDNPEHPAFMSALKWASEHGYGKPTQEIVGIDATPTRRNITVHLVGSNGKRLPIGERGGSDEHPRCRA